MRERVLVPLDGSPEGEAVLAEVWRLAPGSEITLVHVIPRSSIPVGAAPDIAFTVPYVPTGMNAGVSIAPCTRVNRPLRAAPSRWPRCGRRPTRS